MHHESYFYNQSISTTNNTLLMNTLTGCVQTINTFTSIVMTMNTDTSSVLPINTFPNIQFLSFIHADMLKMDFYVFSKAQHLFYAVSVMFTAFLYFHHFLFSGCRTSTGHTETTSGLFQTYCCVSILYVCHSTNALALNGCNLPLTLS